MDILYSASAGGFFSPAIHGEVIPEDAVSVTPERHAELLAAQAAGQRIVAHTDGSPIAADQAPPTHEQQLRALLAAVQARLDEVARQLGYDGIAAAVTYADEPAVPAFQAEGRALRAWRSHVWAAAVMLVGGETLPAADALLAALPAWAPITA